MTSLSYISIVIALLLGWWGKQVYNRIRLLLKVRREGTQVLVDESGIARYQRYKKELKSLGPIAPPPGTSKEAAKHFRALSPSTQRQVVAARKLQGLDG